jgi:hypothetical protein
VGRALAVIATLAMVALWIYIFSGAPRRDAPDKLADEAFPVRAEQVCAAARDDLAAIPAAEIEQADDRADLLERSTGRLDTMVDDLADDLPGGDDGEMLREWLGDWRTYNDDRVRWADALRDDPDARFLVTEKAGQQITDPIDAFAETNDMDSCTTPQDA